MTLLVESGSIYINIGPNVWSRVQSNSTTESIRVCCCVIKVQLHSETVVAKDESKADPTCQHITHNIPLRFSHCCSLISVNVFVEFEGEFKLKVNKLISNQF